MIKMDVVNWKGEKVSSAEAAEEMFSASLDKPLLHRVVCWQLAKRRRGTHSAKTRGEVRGGGKKPFRQKGTGSARQGSIRSPLLRGGGVIHGPKPRSYGERLPHKIRKKALASALSYLFHEKRLLIIESMQSESGKTKELALRLKGAGWKKALLVDDPLEEKFQRALQNIPDFKLIPPEGVNVYDILKFDRMALTVRALQVLSEKRFGKDSAAPPRGAEARSGAEKRSAAKLDKPAGQTKAKSEARPKEKNEAQDKGKGAVSREIQSPAASPPPRPAESQPESQTARKPANQTESQTASAAPADQTAKKPANKMKNKALGSAPK